MPHTLAMKHSTAGLGDMGELALRTQVCENLLVVALGELSGAVLYVWPW